MLLFDNINTRYNYGKDFGELTLRFDGSIQKNPDGDMGWGWCLESEGEIIADGYGWQIYDGRNKTTVNLAEFSGLYFGCKYVMDEGFAYTKLRVIGDSQFVINTVSGRYRLNVSNPYGFIAMRLAEEILPQLTNVKFKWQRRDRNYYCDELSTRYRLKLEEYN